MAFFEVTVFNPIAKRYVHLDFSKEYQQKKEKKKKELQRTYIRSRTW